MKLRVAKKYIRAVAWYHERAHWRMTTYREALRRTDMRSPDYVVDKWLPVPTEKAFIKMHGRPLSNCRYSKPRRRGRSRDRARLGHF